MNDLSLIFTLVFVLAVLMLYVFKKVQCDHHTGFPRKMSTLPLARGYHTEIPVGTHYVVCLKCGEHFPYEWDKLGDEEINSPIDYLPNKRSLHCE